MFSFFDGGGLLLFFLCSIFQRSSRLIVIYLKIDMGFVLFLSRNKHASTQQVFDRETNTLTRSQFSVFYSCRLSTPDLRKLNERKYYHRKNCFTCPVLRVLREFKLSESKNYLSWTSGQVKDFSLYLIG